MPVEQEHTKVKDGDQEKDVLLVKFSNGALEQLKKLKEFYKISEEGDVIQMGISFLQKIMEGESNKPENPST